MNVDWRGLRARPFEFSYPDEPTRAVRGRVVLPPDSAAPGPSCAWPWVLVLHGFKGFMDWGFFPLLQERLAGAGFAVVACTTSGSGVGADLRDIDDDEAFARDTVTRQLEDLRRVRALVLETPLGAGLDPRRGGLFGHSRGGGVGILHAAEVGAGGDGGYRAVVTWAAIDAVDRFDPETKARWRRDGSLAVPNARLGRDHRLDLAALEDAEDHARTGDVLGACARLRCPLLIVHGTEDRTVPMASAERLKAVSGSRRAELRLVEGSDHVFGARHPLEHVPEVMEEVLGRTVAWFRENLHAPGPSAVETPSEPSG